MSALGSLVVKLGLDYAQYTAGLNKSEQDALTHAKRIQDTMDGIKGQVATAAAGVAGVLAATLSINAFKGLLDGAVASAAGLHDLAIQAGTTVGALSGLASVGKFSDMAATDIAGAMNKLTKNLTSVTEDSAGTGKAIRLLGLDLTTFAALKPEDQMMAVAKSLDGFQDGAEKSAVMMALYGKEGAKMLPMMKDLADVGELQAKITDDQAAAADNYDDNLKRITASSDAWKKELVMGMIPALDNAAQAYLDVMNGTGGMRDEVKKLSKDGSIAEWTTNGITAITYLLDTFSGLKAVVKTVGETLGAVVAAGVETFGGIGAAVARVLKGDFAGAYAEMNSANTRANAVWASLGDTVKDVWGEQTLGSKIRARMAELQAAGTVAQATKAKLDATGLGKTDKADKAKQGVDEFAQALDRVLAKENQFNADYDKTLKALYGGYQQGRIGADDYAKAVEALIKQQPFFHAGLKKQWEASEQARKSAAAYASDLDRVALADMDVIELANQYTETIDARIRATEFEAGLIGKSNGERSIALKQYQIEIELQKQILDIKKKLASQKEQDDAIAAVTRAAGRAKSNAAAEVVNEEFKRVSDQIEQSLTDSLMRGFEKGKGFAQNLADTISNMFKTLVLRPIVSAIVSPMAAGIAGGMGLAGTASAATGAASGMGAIGSTLGALGTGLGAGASMIAGGGISGWLSASTSLIGTGTGAGVAAGLGALAGPIGAVLAIASLVKSLDDSGTMHTGGLGGYSKAGGAVVGNAAKTAGLGFDLASADYTASSEKAAVAMAKAVANMLDSTASTFGQQAGYFAATAFADDSSKDGAWGALMVKIGDQIAIDWKDGQDRWPGREFADGEAGAQQYAAAVAKDVRDYLITQTPDWADAALSALGDSVTLENLAATVTQINATEDALQGMGRASKAFADMGEEVSNTLIKALGGAQAAAQSMGSYYGNFYSAPERQTITRNQLTAAAKTAGIDALPTDRAGYRALVDSTLASGNTALAAALIQYSDAFASTTEVISTAAAQVAATVADAAPKISEFDKAVKDLGQSATATAIDLARAMGDEAGARAAERAQYLAGFAQLSQAEQDRLGSLYDQNQAIRDQISAIEKAKAVADERKGIERQLLELTGDTAAIRALELAALDPTNRAMQARVYALEDEKTALEAATKAAETASQAFLQLVNAAYGSADRFLDAANSREFKLAVLAHKLTQAGGPEDTQSYANAMGGMTAEDVKSFVTQFIYSGASAEQKSVILEIGNSLLDMLDKSAEASKTAAKLIEDAAKRLQDAGKGVGEWITKTRADLLGTRPEAETLQALRSNYLTDLSSGRANNLDALGRITGSADAYLKAAVDQSSTAAQARATISQVLAEMASLPAVQSYETQSLALLGKIDTSTATSATLTAEGIAATLGTTFDGFDVNVDGGISFAEMQAALAGKATDAELKALFSLVDTDNDGIISKLEAVKASTNATTTALLTTIASKFDAIDLNVDGGLTLAEMQTALAGKASDSAIKALFTMLDADNDGIISRLEAVKGSTANIKSNFWDTDQLGLSAALQWHMDMLLHTVSSTNYLDGILARLNAGINVFGLTGTTPAVAAPMLTQAQQAAIALQPAATPSYDAGLSQAAQNHLAAGGSAQAIYDTIKASGMTLAQAEAVLGATPGSFAEEARKLGLSTFALGGVFTNGIVTRPTAFGMGVMGEAGPEAIMPLANIGGGLGVRYAGPDFSDFGRAIAAMATEITTLRAELQGLRAEARATAVNTGRTQDLLKRVSRNGEALQTEAAT